MGLMHRRLAARYGENYEELDEEAPRRVSRTPRTPEMQRALDYMAAHPLDGSLDTTLDTVDASLDTRASDDNGLLAWLLRGAK